MRRIVLLSAGGHYGRGRTSGASAVEESIVRAALVDKCLGGDIVLILGAQLIRLALAANYYLENQTNYIKYCFKFNFVDLLVHVVIHLAAGADVNGPTAWRIKFARLILRFHLWLLIQDFSG